MDRITKSLLEEFKKVNSLTKLEEDVAFEHFCASLLIGRLFDETTDFSENVVGGGADLGIDAIAIIANGQLMLSAKHVDEVVQANGYLDVQFIFIQSETSSSFDGQKIGNFADGIEEFFADQPALPRNSDITRAARIMDRVYANSSKFKPNNPVCSVFYCTTGVWTADAHLDGKRKRALDRLMKLNLFRVVDFEAVDARRLQKLSTDSKNALSRDFVFDKQTVIPDIDGVAEAYLGVMPASEFIRLITDSDGDMVRSIFYDNVRDWQDFNSVNSEIRGTLIDKGLSSRFSIMNNGVTIIARVMKRTADKFHIENYQIVNGCQTSNVLFACKDDDLSSVNVPVRLISTSNEDIINSIIKATNRQTNVSEEQLLAVSDFQKQLENYFSSFEGKKKLYYERRSRQYSQMDVEKVRIVSMTTLIRSFSAAFLDLPHQTMRSYKTLLGNVGRRIFADDHKLETYYAAAYALYKLEFLIRNQSLDAKFRQARYQLLMIFRVLVAGDESPPLNSRKSANIAEKMLSVLQDEHEAARIFRTAGLIIEGRVGTLIDRDTVHTEKFTKVMKSDALAAFCADRSGRGGEAVAKSGVPEKGTAKKPAGKKLPPKKTAAKKATAKKATAKKATAKKATAKKAIAKKATAKKTTAKKATAKKATAKKATAKKATAKKATAKKATR